MIPFLIFLTFILLFFMSLIGRRNRIIVQYNKVRQAWSDVVIQERQKLKTLPEIERLAREHKEFEGSVLSSVAKMRSAHMELGNSPDMNVEALKQAMEASRQVQRSFAMTVEAYPQLRTVNLYSDVIKQTVEQEDNVAASLRLYNHNVFVFNAYIGSFPNNMINAMFTRKKQLQLFENQEAVESLGFSPQF